MADNELLLAISDMMDKKLKPVNDRLKKIELTQEMIFFHVYRILKLAICQLTRDINQVLNKLKRCRMT